MVRPSSPDATGPNRRLPTCSWDSCRCPAAVKTTPYSFLSPKARLSTYSKLGAQWLAGYFAGRGLSLVDDEVRFATGLFRGTAGFYDRYRPPYPQAMLADL